MSLKFAKSTTHRYKKKWTLALQTYSVPAICNVYHTEIQKSNGQSLPKKQKNQGLTLALETLSVLDICNVCHTKKQEFRKIRWRYKLTVSLKFASLPYEDPKKYSRVDVGVAVSSKFKKFSIHRNKNSRVDVGVTNLLCP